MHGGGNFGDLWRIHTNYRHKILKLFQNNQIIFFPQTINYANTQLAIEDSKLYSVVKNLTITVRSHDSVNFALKYFSKNKVLFVPDMAFMLGPQRAIQEPIFDVFILKRKDKESKFNTSEWYGAIELLNQNKYSYVIKDWFDYKINITDRTILSKERVRLVNKILSQGKVILTDRLHASLFSLLLGKPHVIVDDKFKKIYNTRESAFKNKIQCKQDYFGSFYSTSPLDAAKKTISILSNL